MTAIIAFAAHRIKTAKNTEKAEDAVKTGNTNIEAATNGDPKVASKSIVTSEGDALPIIKRNISIRESLMDNINQQEERIIGEIEKNQVIIEKLREYLGNHQRDNMDAGVTDPELVEEYPTLGEAIEGAKKLEESNAAKMEELATTSNWRNLVTSGTTSDQNRINEDEVSETNTESLSDYT